MDILYTVKNTVQNEELLYSLRTLKNLPHDRIFIVGGCPKSINQDKIIYIPRKQSGTKYQNTTNNLKVACLDERLSNDFILMNDDFFILRPVENIVNELNCHIGTITSRIQRHIMKYGKPSKYCNGAEETRNFIRKITGDWEPLSYELHIPMVLNKEKFLKMFDLPGIEDISVLHKRTLYGNLYYKNSKEIPDVKCLNGALFDWHYAEERKFLSSSDDSWVFVRSYLIHRFPEKSEYEI